MDREKWRKKSGAGGENGCGGEQLYLYLPACRLLQLNFQVSGCTRVLGHPNSCDGLMAGHK